MTTEQIDRLKECESAIEQLEHLQKYLVGLKNSESLGSMMSIKYFGSLSTQYTPEKQELDGNFAQVHKDDWQEIYNVMDYRIRFWQQEIEKI